MNLKATLFAWRNGIPLIEFIGVWHGYSVYHPKHASKTALPVLVFANSSEVRFASESETFACLNGIVS